MADTTFVAGTPIVSAWLNDVNDATYTKLANVTTISAAAAGVLDEATTGAMLTAIGGAPTASPTFTGTPTLPTGTIAVTQAAATSNTTVATTAFVQQEVPAASTTAAGKAELATTAEVAVGTDTARVPSVDSMQNGKIVLGTAVTPSGTSVDFTSIPAWVKRVTMFFSAVSTSGTSPIIIQLGDSGGVETSGYVGNVSQGQQANNWVVSATSTAGFSMTTGAAAGHSYTGKITLSRMNGNEWIADGVWAQMTATITTNHVVGSKTLTATLDRVRLTTVGGADTFDAGSLNIVYE